MNMINVTQNTTTRFCVLFKFPVDIYTFWGGGGGGGREGDM